MADNFIRAYQFSVGILGEEVSNQTNKEVASNIPVQFFTDLQFTGNVTYSIEQTEGGTDQTTFEVTNLNKGMKDLIAQKDSVIILRAGYASSFDRDENGRLDVKYQDLPLIYFGNVVYSYTTKRGVDLVTTIVCSNDKKERASRIATIRYPKGVSKDTVLRDLASRLGFSYDPDGLPDLGSLSYENGYNVYGSISEAFSKFCRENNLNWFVQNKNLRVRKSELKDADEEKDTVTQSIVWDVTPNQVVGTLETFVEKTVVVSSTTESSGEKYPDNLGVKLTVFLDGRLQIGDYVNIGFSDFQGVYEVQSLTHNMSYRGGQWVTTLELRKKGVVVQQ